MMAAAPGTPPLQQQHPYAWSARSETTSNRISSSWAGGCWVKESQTMKRPAREMWESFSNLSGHPGIYGCMSGSSEQPVHEAECSHFQNLEGARTGLSALQTCLEGLANGVCQWNLQEHSMETKCGSTWLSPVHSGLTEDVVVGTDCLQYRLTARTLPSAAKSMAKSEISTDLTGTLTKRQPQRSNSPESFLSACGAALHRLRANSSGHLLVDAPEGKDDTSAHCARTSGRKCFHLGIIEERLHRGYYKHPAQFVEHVRKVFRTALGEAEVVNTEIDVKGQIESLWELFENDVHMYSLAPKVDLNSLVSEQEEALQQPMLPSSGRHLDEGPEHSDPSGQASPSESPHGSSSSRAGAEGHSLWSCTVSGAVSAGPAADSGAGTSKPWGREGEPGDVKGGEPGNGALGHSMVGEQEGSATAAAEGSMRGSFEQYQKPCKGFPTQVRKPRSSLCPRKRTSFRPLLVPLSMVTPGHSSREDPRVRKKPRRRYPLIETEYAKSKTDDGTESAHGQAVGGSPGELEALEVLTGLLCSSDGGRDTLCTVSVGQEVLSRPPTADAVGTGASAELDAHFVAGINEDNVGFEDDGSAASLLASLACGSKQEAGTGEGVMEGSHLNPFVEDGHSVHKRKPSGNGSLSAVLVHKLRQQALEVGGAGLPDNIGLSDVTWAGPQVESPSSSCSSHVLSLSSDTLVHVGEDAAGTCMDSFAARGNAAGSKEAQHATRLRAARTHHPAAKGRRSPLAFGDLLQDEVALEGTAARTNAGAWCRRGEESSAISHTLQGTKTQLEQADGSKRVHPATEVQNAYPEDIAGSAARTRGYIWVKAGRCRKVTGAGQVRGAGPIWSQRFASHSSAALSIRDPVDEVAGALPSPATSECPGTCARTSASFDWAARRSASVHHLAACGPQSFSPAEPLASRQPALDSGSNLVASAPVEGAQAGQLHSSRPRVPLVSSHARQSGAALLAPKKTSSGGGPCDPKLQGQAIRDVNACRVPCLGSQPMLPLHRSGSKPLVPISSIDPLRNASRLSLGGKAPNGLVCLPLTYVMGTPVQPAAVSMGKKETPPGITALED